MESYLLGARVNSDSAANLVRRDIIAIAMQSTNKTEGELLSMMSKYGNKNSREFFAEAFASYKLGGNNVWARAMSKYLKGKNCDG